MDCLGILAIFDLQQVGSWFEAGGYIVLFALLFACGLGLPLPEDIPLTLAGFFMATQQWNLGWIAIFAWCGIIGGDCVLYHLGRKYGLNITRIPFVGKHVTQQRILKAEELFDRYGIWVVAIGRLFAGIRGDMVVAAGATRYNFFKFVIADGVAALVSGGLFVALGHWIGRRFGTLDKIRQFRQDIEHIEFWVLLGVIVLVALIVLYVWWRRRKHKTLVDAAMDKVVKHAEHSAHPPKTAHPGDAPAK